MSLVEIKNLEHRYGNHTVLAGLNLTLEEGEICEGDPSLLRDFYRMGARMMTLTWNYPNQLGYPAKATGGEFAGKVFVVDNGRVATPMHRSVLDAVEMTEKGYSAAEIKKILEETREKMTIYIGLSTLEYLKKGGRVSSVTALAADVLNIKPVMHFSTGTLDTYQKCRGMKKARKVMIDAMKHELETNFREEYEAGNVYLMAASSSTDEVTAEWMAQIKESFPGMDVMCDKLSFGLSCHIGPDGLGIGCTCKPVE